MGRLFGTDGVRGVANAPPLTPEFTCRLGRIAAACPPRPSLDPAASRAPDRSGHPRFRPLLEQALVAGVLSVGVDALVAGVLPTPAVAASRPRWVPPAGWSCPRPSRSRTTASSSSRRRVTSCPTRGRTRPRRAFSPAGRAPSDGSRPGTAAPVPGAEGRYLDGLRSSLPVDSAWPAGGSCSTVPTAQPIASARASSGRWGRRS